MGSYTVDVNEYGAEKDGAKQVLNERLFMQLLAYGCPADMQVDEVIAQLGEALGATGIGAVIYQDVNDPTGLAVLSWSKDPGDLVTKTRKVLSNGAFRQLAFKPSYTMLGRTYSSGYERDLKHWIIDRPANNVSDPAWPWAVWYPLRRHGKFEQLPGREQGGILREHAVIGRAYGEQGLAHDVRLRCQGLDPNDNDFVIGLLGKELYPLSHVVQTMRKTRQTSEYIQQMGPFFIGYAVWRSHPATS